MAAKLSDLVDKMPGTNLQANGHAEVPTQGAKDLWELEEEDSSPSHLLSLSPAQRPLSGHPNTKYCLEIRVMLTEELGAIPPPCHSWTAPLVEDMLHEARTRLTEAVVTGPCRAVLFYGRHSMGEGLRVDEARNATFLLTGAGTWVGKSAYLTADPMTIQDVLNQELFQLWMADKETVLDWGVCLSRHLQILAAFFPDCFPPDRVAELKRDHFYGRLPK